MDPPRHSCSRPAPGGEVLKEEASNKGVILSCWESVFWNAAMPIVCFCVLFLVSFLFMLFEKNFWQYVYSSTCSFLDWRLNDLSNQIDENSRWDSQRRCLDVVWCVFWITISSNMAPANLIYLGPAPPPQPARVRIYPILFHQETFAKNPPLQRWIERGGYSFQTLLPKMQIFPKV